MKHMSVSPVCKHITCKQCLWRSEQCIRSPGIGVTSVTWERESKSGPLKEQQILFHSRIIFSKCSSSPLVPRVLSFLALGILDSFSPHPCLLFAYFPQRICLLLHKRFLLGCVPLVIRASLSE